MRETERELLMPEEQDENEEVSQIGLHGATGNRVAALANIRSLIRYSQHWECVPTPITMALAHLCSGCTQV